MNKNLRLYITPENYSVWAGGDWPSYDDFMDGQRPTHPIAVDLVDKMLKYHVEEQGMVFPIRTATACQSKWTWSTIYLNELRSSSCHRVNGVDIDVDNFSDFHNLPKKIEDRKLMLEGKWPTGGCEYCKRIEDQGGFSDRLHNLEIPNLTPPELLTDPTATHVTPRIVEIFAENTCNFKCVYCNDSLSSKIEQENKKYGNFSQNGVSIPVVQTPTKTAKAVLEKFYNWLNLNITSLRRLHLLGGETFLQTDLLDSVLNIIEQNACPDLELCIFSNFNVPDSLWNNYLDKIKQLQNAKHIKVFDLTASIDCWGKEAKYVRHGLDLELFENKFEWASQQGDWLRLNVNQTITAMTIKTMPDLNNIISKYGKHKHIGQYFEFYVGDHYFQHPEIFAYSFWAKDFDRIFETMQDQTAEHREAQKRMQGIQKQLQNSTAHNFAEINKLKTYLSELDKRRNQDWKTVFPYLDV